MGNAWCYLLTLNATATRMLKNITFNHFLQFPRCLKVREFLFISTDLNETKWSEWWISLILPWSDLEQKRDSDQKGEKKWLKIRWARGKWRQRRGKEERISRMDRETEAEIVQVSGGRSVGGSAWNRRPLDWFDPTTLPWQQYGRALLLFQAAWGLEHVCVFVCACVCGYECIKSDTGFHAGNNKVHGFTWLCWGLEIHRGSTFSSQRKVYAFCIEECQ